MVGVTLVVTLIQVAPGDRDVKPASAATVASPRFLRTFISANEDWRATTALTQDLAVEQAKGVDLIIAGKWAYRSYVTAMKTANPTLTLLAYGNAAYAQQAQGPTSGAFLDPFYARQAGGYYLRSSGWGNWLMDPSNSGWINTRKQEGADTIAFSGYDGIWWDMLTPAPLLNGYNYASTSTGTSVAGVPTLPINPATKLPWTRTDWLRATANIFVTTQAGLAGKAVSGNGLVNGAEYFRSTGPTSTLFSAGANDLMAETFIRNPEDGIAVHRDQTSWKKDVDMLVDAASRGRRVQAMTKVDVDGTLAEKDAWHKYALGSFLLGSDGNSYFSFRYDHDRVRPHRWWSKANEIGTPLAAYEPIGAAYRRAFTNGLVLVNPTTWPVTVPLSGTFTDLDGNPKASSITLAPHTGEVLVKWCCPTTTTTASSTTSTSSTTTVAPPTTTTTVVRPTTTTTTATTKWKRPKNRMS